MTRLTEIHRLPAMENAITDSQKFDLILARMDNIDTRLDKIGGRLDKIEVRLDKIEVRLDKIEVRLDESDVRLNKIEARIEEVRLDLSTRIDDLGAQMTAMEIKILDKIGSLYDLNDRTEKQVVLIEQRLAVVEARLSGLDGRLSNQANLEKKFNQLDDRLHALEKKIA